MTRDFRELTYSVSSAVFTQQTHASECDFIKNDDESWRETFVDRFSTTSSVQRKQTRWVGKPFWCSGGERNYYCVSFSRPTWADAQTLLRFSISRRRDEQTVAMMKLFLVINSFTAIVVFGNLSKLKWLTCLTHQGWPTLRWTRRYMCWMGGIVYVHETKLKPFVALPPISKQKSLSRFFVDAERASSMSRE